MGARTGLDVLCVLSGSKRRTNFILLHPLTSHEVPHHAVLPTCLLIDINCTKILRFTTLFQTHSN